mmetsp:Transcript_4373/g.5394  ORF Transcript_4373/g.5394 Transcript_4373/m.5394 type:complete len:107 (-) Transcript_4373:785-1105(-)
MLSLRFQIFQGTNFGYSIGSWVYSIHYRSALLCFCDLLLHWRRDFSISLAVSVVNGISTLSSGNLVQISLLCLSTVWNEYFSRSSFVSHCQQEMIGFPVCSSTLAG